MTACNNFAHSGLFLAPTLLQYLIIAITLLSGTLCHGQEKWEWARSIAAHIDGSGSDRSIEEKCSAIATDHEGNVYLVGHFSDSIVQEGFRLFTAPRTQTLTPVEIFVAKFDPKGKLLWLRGFEGHYVYSATVDSKNNFYIVGTFGPSMTVGDTTVYGRAGFIIKYTPQGEFEWVRTCNGEVGIPIILGVSAIEEDIYFTGRNWSGNHDSVRFGSYTLYDPYSFVGKLTSNGTIEWFKAIETGYPHFVMGVSASADGNGCYVCQTYHILHYTASGELVDSIIIPRATLNMLTSNRTSICAVGRFRDSISVGPFTLRASSSDFTMFMVVFSLDGKPLHLRVGISNSSDAYGVCLDSAGSYYVTGRFKPTIRFDDLSVGLGPSTSSFVLRVDPEFHASYLYAPPDPNNDCYLSTLASTKNNEIVAAGFYRDTVQFGSHFVNAVSEFPDVVLAKLGFNSAVHEAKALLDDLSLFPVPATDVLHIKMEYASDGLILIYDLFGREVLRSTETSLDVSSLPSGIYRLVIQLRNSVKSRTVQIVR